MILTAKQAEEKNNESVSVYNYKEVIAVVLKKICETIEDTCDKSYCCAYVDLTELLLNEDIAFPLREYEDMIASGFANAFISKGYYAKTEIAEENDHMMLCLYWHNGMITIWNWITSAIKEFMEEEKI